MPHLHLTGNGRLTFHTSNSYNSPHRLSNNNNNNKKQPKNANAQRMDKNLMLSGRHACITVTSRPFGLSFSQPCSSFPFVSDSDPMDINGREQKQAYQIYS